MDVDLEVVEVSVLMLFRFYIKADVWAVRYAATSGLRGRLSERSE